MLTHQSRRVLDRLFHGSGRFVPCALVVAGLISGCDKMALLAPSGTAITLQFPATGAVVALNSSISITATVIEQGGSSVGTGTAATPSSAGTPVQNGTAVSFTTTLGTIQPSTASTVNGQVTVQLVTGSTSGTAVVNAFSGAAHATAVTITVGSPVTAGSHTTLAITAPASPAVSTPATFVFTPTAAGGTTITDVTINFDDGSPVLHMGPISSAAAVSHLFAVKGTYNVSALATDSTGATAAAATAIVVTPLGASVAVTTTGAAAAGSPITFAVTNSPAGASIDHYEWNFGDGATTTSSGTTQSHAYGSTGTFNVSVLVVPMAGPAFTITTQVKIT